MEQACDTCLHAEVCCRKSEYSTYYTSIMRVQTHPLFHINTATDGVLIGCRCHASLPKVATDITLVQNLTYTREDDGNVK